MSPYGNRALMNGYNREKECFFFKIYSILIENPYCKFLRLDPEKKHHGKADLEVGEAADADLDPTKTFQAKYRGNERFFFLIDGKRRIVIVNFLHLI